MVAAQLFTLAGVALGALASYLVSSLNEGTRFRREVARGWEARKFDCFATYINDVKVMSDVAKNMAASLNLHDRYAAKLGIDEGSPQLTEAENRRSVSMERLRLLSDAETITAAHRLNEAVWQLEWIARGRISNATPKQWEHAQSAFTDAFDTFHHCARQELGVPGQHVIRQIGRLPSLDTAQGETKTNP